MTASPLDRVLALRPTNVVARLGAGGPLPLLNPRDLLATLRPGAALITAPVYADEVVAGALRAAREADAVLGLSCPWPLGDRDAPARVTQVLAREAASVRHRAPVFLQAGPISLTSTDPGEIERVTGAVWDFVEAGFTLVSLDASALDVRGALGVAEAAQTVVERELSLELVPPLDPSGRFDAERAGLFFEALAQGDVLPQWLRLPAKTYSFSPHAREPFEVDLSVLGEAQAVASAHGAALSVEVDGPSPERLAQILLGAGVRKLEATGLFSTASSAPQSLRAEVRCHGAAQELLAGFGARGSASRAVQALAKGSRY